MSNLVFDESSSNREASHGYAWWFSGDTFEKAMAEDRKPRKRGLTRRLSALQQGEQSEPDKGGQPEQTKRRKAENARDTNRHGQAKAVCQPLRQQLGPHRMRQLS